MLDIKTFPRHEIHKPPFPNSTLNRKRELFPLIFDRHFTHPARVWDQPWGFISSRTPGSRLEVSLMSLNPTSNALVGRGKLLESTQEEGQKG